MMPLQRCWDNFFTKGETGIRKQLEAVKWLELIALTKPFKAEGNKVEILLLYPERPSSIEENVKGKTFLVMPLFFRQKATSYVTSKT